MHNNGLLLMPLLAMAATQIAIPTPPSLWQTHDNPFIGFNDHFEGIWTQKHANQNNDTMRTVKEWDCLVNNATSTPVIWKRPTDNFLWECASECCCKWFAGRNQIAVVLL